MPLKVEQLGATLARGLAPVHLIAGDDPVRVADACAQVRSAAREAGFAQRELHTVESGFDWAAFGAGLGTASLFASRRLVELDIGEGRIGQAGERTLSAYLGRPDPDVLLLVRGAGFERSVREAKWVAACERAGVYVDVWPLPADGLARWAQARAAARGLRLEADGAALLAEWAQGNTAVAAQAIERLALTAPAGARLDAAAVRDAADDGARFDVRDLTEAALAGDAGRALRVLARLREEGTEPPLLVWSLAAAVRALASGRAPPGGRGPQQAAERARRRTPARAWRALLPRAAQVDRISKGAAPGSAWAGLAELVLRIAGRPAPAGES